MPLIQRARISSQKLAANRRNAWRSTGPRSPEAKRRVRLNALRHGLRARLFFEAMQELGEDPKEFEAMRRGFMESFCPANVAEAVIVEDLAKLWWRKERVERVQAGVQVQELKQRQCERLREMCRMNREAIQESDEEIRQVGLLRLPDSRGKFEQAQELLDLLLAHVEGREHCEAPPGALRLLYGEKATWRGAALEDLFRKLADEEAAGTDLPLGPDRGSPDSPLEPSSGEAAASPAVPRPSAGEKSFDALPRQLPTRALLRVALLEEIGDVLNEHEMYLQGHVDLSRTGRDALLAPADSRWTWILRQENMLERHFDRKLKQLLKLQSLRLRVRRQRTKSNGSNGMQRNPRPASPPGNGFNPNPVRKMEPKRQKQETLELNQQCHDLLPNQQVTAHHSPLNHLSEASLRTIDASSPPQAASFGERTPATHSEHTPQVRSSWPPPAPAIPAGTPGSLVTAFRYNGVREVEGAFSKKHNVGFSWGSSCPQP